MPTKATNETIAKRLVNARKELDGFAARKKKSEEFLASYDNTVAELTAEVEHYDRLATGRGLTAEEIETLGATTPGAKATITADV